MVLFCTTIAKAQDTVRYFNKTYWADTMNLLTPIGVATNDGYYLIGNCISVSQTSVFVMKTDLAGNQEWWVNVDVKGNEDIPSLQLGVQAIISKDSCLVFTYTKRVFGNGLLRDIYLVKMRLDGTIIWNKQQVGYGEEQALQVIETHDGGFALFGFQYYENDTTKYYLVKTDTAGVEQWHQSYVLDEHSVGLSFQQTADGGYILGGYGYSNATQYDTYIIKTDSLGFVEWTNNFGGQYNDCGGTVNLLANGQYLVLGCDYTSDFFDRYLRLTKLNSAGTIVLDTVYYNKDYKAQQTPAVFLSDSTFVFLTYTFSNITGRVVNVMLHCDLSGNILWEQEFSSNLNEDCYLKDLRRTPDGGFVMAGYEYTSTPQKGYLVKTDSLGRSCSWVGCDSVGYVYPVGIASPLPPPKEGVKEGGLWVYPNPAQDYLTISNLMLEQNATFVLYDVVGKTVLQQTLNSPSFGGGKGEATISTKHLPSGMYLYHIFNPQKQTLQYGKVSIVH